MRKHVHAKKPEQALPEMVRAYILAGIPRMMKKRGISQERAREAFARRARHYLKQFGSAKATRTFDAAVMSNRGLVGDFICKHVGRRLRPEFRDLLMQAGTIGLMRALGDYDPEKAPFAVHAFSRIRNEVFAAMVEVRPAFQFSAGTELTVRGVSRAATAFEKLHKRPATPQDLIGTTMGRASDLRKEDTVQALLDFARSSVTHKFPERPTPSQESLPDPETWAVRSQKRALVRRHLNKLPRRIAKVLKLRYGFGTDEGLTQKETGKKFGFSRQAAQQHELAGIAMLREQLARYDLTP